VSNLDNSKPSENDNLLLKPQIEVGIAGYGAYVPQYRLPASEINRIWKWGKGGVPVKEKAVAGADEDVITMSIEAARNALARAGIDPGELRAVWIGSESHPYAVKPSSTIVAEAIGAVPNIQAADLEFACKAGTEAVVAAMGLVGSGMARYAMAIGMDTAQGRPGDALEYTAASGGAAYILGPVEDSLAAIEVAYSYVTDTPDFWRGAHDAYPSHAGRFTGEPGYFHHMRTTIKGILDTADIKVKDIDHAIFHMPNGKFPSRIAKEFGFSKEQMEEGFIVPHIGNTYSACSLLGLTHVLQKAKKDQKILLVSYGSGAGCDAFVMTMLRNGVPLPVQEHEISYLSYNEYLQRCKTLAAA